MSWATSWATEVGTYLFAPLHGDVQVVLLHPLEEELDLPSRFAESRDDVRWQYEIVSDEDLRLRGLSANERRHCPGWSHSGR